MLATQAYLQHLNCHAVVGAVLPDTQLLSDQTALPSNDLSSDSAWMLPGFSNANVTCHITCNDVEVDANELQLGSEAKSCVGSFKVRVSLFLSVHQPLAVGCS